LTHIDCPVIEDAEKGHHTEDWFMQRWRTFSLMILIFTESHPSLSDLSEAIRTSTCSDRSVFADWKLFPNYIL
jgi:hypothetical protein